MGADLSALDIMVVQIDGIHISEHLMLVAALGIDSQGFKHLLGLMEGATEHSAVVQALIDDLIERGLDPAVPRLEGARQGHPAQLRAPHADPALPDSLCRLPDYAASMHFSPSNGALQGRHIGIIERLGDGKQLPNWPASARCW